MSVTFELWDKVMIHVKEWDDKGYYYGIVESKNVNYSGDYQLQVCNIYTWRPICRKINFRSHEVETVYDVVKNDDIIESEFGDVVLTWWSDVWRDNDWLTYIGKKAKRLSDKMNCLVNLTTKPSRYRYDIVFY